LSMFLTTGYPEDFNFTVESPLVSVKLKINARGVPFVRTLNIPPGTYIIKLVSDARPVNDPKFPRLQVFKVVNLSLK
jgi:hypothetical protein